MMKAPIIMATVTVALSRDLASSAPDCSGRALVLRVLRKRTCFNAVRIIQMWQKIIIPKYSTIIKLNARTNDVTTSVFFSSSQNVSLSRLSIVKTGHEQAIIENTAPATSVMTHRFFVTNLGYRSGRDTAMYLREKKKEKSLMNSFF